MVAMAAATAVVIAVASFGLVTTNPRHRRIREKIGWRG
jgi:hypothetical protein